ncbi:MAG: hypothetical protein IJX63_01825, partial [Lachnospiraceae bacterium]|nr:hypothetical protein [Lachnospiraceae bacterium]
SGSDDGTIVNPDGVIDDITDIVDVVGDIWDGALGAVGGLLSGLVDGLEIVLDPLEKATDLITNILNGVRYMTEDLDTTFKDFTLLMGDMFSFIPEEIINLIKASLGVTVSICLFKWLFK